MKTKPGPKPMSPDMVTICFRAPKWMRLYLKSKGDMSEAARQVIEDAKRDDGQPQPAEVADLITGCRAAMHILCHAIDTMADESNTKWAVMDVECLLRTALAPFEEATK